MSAKTVVALVESDVARGATNTPWPLTHPSDISRIGGLAVDATQKPEEWRPVVGYEGIYEVSDLGRVRSLDRIDCRGWPRRGAIKAQPLHVVEGRPILSLNRDGGRKTGKVQTLVLEAFVGPRPEGMVCCHNDGDKTNNRLPNLRWDTVSSNEYDKVAHGTHNFASREKCPYGHELKRPNLCNYALRQGVRACLACNKGRQRRRTRPHLDQQTASDLMYERIMSGEFRQRKTVI